MAFERKYNLRQEIRKVIKERSEDTLRNIRPLGVCNAQSSYERNSLFDDYAKTVSKQSRGFDKNLQQNGQESDVSTPSKDILSTWTTTFKTPIVNKLKDKGGNLLLDYEKKSVKPRRSMLGMRSRLQNQPVGRDQSQPQHGDFGGSLSHPQTSVQGSLPKEKMPLISPDSTTTLIDFQLHGFSKMADPYEAGSRMMASTPRTPASNPFRNEDPDLTNFFSKGISEEGCWSVFKTIKKPPRATVAALCPPLETPTPSLRSLEDGEERPAVSLWKLETKNPPHILASNPVPPRKTTSVQDRLKQAKSGRVCQEKPQQLQQEPLQLQQEPQVPSRGWATNYHKQPPTSPFSRVTSVFAEKETSSNNLPQRNFAGNSLRSNEEDIPRVTDDISTENEAANSGGEDEGESSDAMDSYLNNEKTIVGISMGGETILEEEEEDRGLREEHREESETEPELVGRIIRQMAELNKEKEAIDTKWRGLIKEQTVWDQKWSGLMEALERYRPEQLPRRTASCKSARVVCSKVRRSCSTPTNLKLKGGSSRYSMLKASYTSLKTPLAATKQKFGSRKSICYTPNSLTMSVAGQLKDIFNDS